MSAIRWAAILLLVWSPICGCDATPSTDPSDLPASLKPGVRFHDSVESNIEINDDQFDFAFVDRLGKNVDLKDYRGQKNVVLVVTRGYSGGFCPLCSAQTSRLIRNHEEFVSRNTELLVVFPGSQEKATSFVDQLSENAESGDESVPFSIVLDEGLAFVDKLMIRGDLAKPSTYIIDRSGVLRFAYVGTTPSDRPSLKAILDQLDSIENS